MDSTGCGGCSWCWVSSQLVNRRVLWHLSLSCSSAVLMTSCLATLQAFCYSCEDSSTTPESARWRTTCPTCPALESSSSIEPPVLVSTITFFLFQWDVMSSFIHSKREKRTSFFPSFISPALLDMFWTIWNLGSPSWCDIVNADNSVKPLSLVVNCHVLSAILRCVTYKWMPYLLYVGCNPVRPPGGSLVCVIFQELLSAEVICIEKCFSAQGSVGNLGVIYTA